MKRARVVIIEDDTNIRESYKLIINSSDKFQIVGDYASCEDALRQILKLKPDIVLMDIVLPGIDGIEGTKYIKEKLHYVEVVMITVLEDSKSVFEALKAGASGYISKSANLTEILASLEEIVKGGAPMSTKVARHVIEHFHINHIDNPLANRESQVLSLLSSGKTYSQISDVMEISKETVKTHIRNIYKKLGVNKKSAAIEKGKKERIIN